MLNAANTIPTYNIFTNVHNILPPLNTFVVCLSIKIRTLHTYMYSDTITVKLYNLLLTEILYGPFG